MLPYQVANAIAHVHIKYYLLPVCTYNAVLYNSIYGHVHFGMLAEKRLGPGAKLQTSKLERGTPCSGACQGQCKSELCANLSFLE